MHRTRLPGMSEEQPGEPDDHEQRDHQRQTLHVVDEQKSAPTRRSAVQLMLQPQKTERDRREAQQQAALIVAGPLIARWQRTRRISGEQPGSRIGPKSRATTRMRVPRHRALAPVSSISAPPPAIV